MERGPPVTLVSQIILAAEQPINKAFNGLQKRSNQGYARVNPVC